MTQTMDKAAQTMLDNLRKNTGRDLAEWIALVRGKGFAKHGEAMKFLKEEQGLTHGYANLIALKARGSDAGSAASPEELVEKQYKGREHLRPIYEAVVDRVRTFGSDVEIAPKNSSVSLRRKKQFALLTPATRTRFEIGINLKGQPAEGLLKAETRSNAMCSHKMELASESELHQEVFAWLKKAYENAG